MNNNIKEKIAKLLALAESPNENEAKAALLKARALMVQHKLRPEECTGKKEKVVTKVLADIKCTTMTDFWIYKLSDVIAFSATQSTASRGNSAPFITRESGRVTAQPISALPATLTATASLPVSIRNTRSRTPSIRSGDWS